MTDKMTSKHNRHSVSLLRKTVLPFVLSSALSTSAMFLLSGTNNVSHAAPVIGTSAAVKGEVFVVTEGAKRKAQIKGTIKLDDQVTTKRDSALQILLLDQSTFTVGQNCNMVIDRFIYDPDTSAGEIGAKVVKGAFRFMSGNIGKKSETSASITTPTATIGIRGTFLEGIVGADAVALAQLGGINTQNANRSGASIIILRGPGPNSNTLDKQGALSVTTSGGTKAVTQPNYFVFDPGNGSAPIGPFPVTPEMQEYLDFFLRSSPNGDSENPIPISDDVNRESGQEKFETPTEFQDDQYEDLVDGIQKSLEDDCCPGGYVYVGP